MSRTTNGDWLFDDRERRMLQSLAWRAADYCGVLLLTHAMMPNHPHLKVHVPLRREMPNDAELVRRYEVLNPPKTRRAARRLEVVKAHLTANDAEAADWRKRQFAQMGDLSAFMKIVKQRFTMWFNRVHGRFGTIWSERFKSVLVEENSDALLPISAYVDLNPVRAGFVKDPKDYPFTGYASAVAGNVTARKGIMFLTSETTWDRAQASYRMLLYAIGVKARQGKRVMSIEQFEAVAAKQGKLSKAEILRVRIRHFTDGGIIGSERYVAEKMAEMRHRLKRRRPTKAVPLPPVTDWGGLATMRRLRRG